MVSDQNKWFTIYLSDREKPCAVIGWCQIWCITWVNITSSGQGFSRDHKYWWECENWLDNLYNFFNCKCIFFDSIGIKWTEYTPTEKWNFIHNFMIVFLSVKQWSNLKYSTKGFVLRAFTRRFHVVGKWKFT